MANTKQDNTRDLFMAFVESARDSYDDFNDFAADVQGFLDELNPELQTYKEHVEAEVRRLMNGSLF